MRMCVASRPMIALVGFVERIDRLFVGSVVNDGTITRSGV
jgi:hypothetical protein